MKKVSIYLLLVLILFVCSCKSDDYLNNQLQQPGDCENLIYDVEVNYYFNTYKLYTSTYKNNNIVFPKLIDISQLIYNLDFPFGRDYDFGNQFILSKNMDRTIYRKPYIQVEWYLDENFEIELSNLKDKNINLYAKPIVLFDERDDYFKIGSLETYDIIPNDVDKYITIMGSLIDTIYLTTEYISLNNDLSLVNNTYHMYSLESSSPSKLIGGLLYYASNVKKIIINSDYFYMKKYDKRIIKSNDLGENNNIEEIIINGDLDIIQSSAIRNMKNLQTIIINGKINSIEKWAFRELPSLKKIIINGVNEIDSEAFKLLPEGFALEIN